MCTFEKELAREIRFLQAERDRIGDLDKGENERGHGREKLSNILREQLGVSLADVQGQGKLAIKIRVRKAVEA